MKEIINVPLGQSLDQYYVGHSEITYSEIYILDGLYVRDWTCEWQGKILSGWEVLGN